MHRPISHPITAPRAAAAAAVLLGSVLAGAGTGGAQQSPSVNEDFDASPGVMEPGPGGWEVSGHRYGTHDPVRSGAGTIGNSNLSLAAPVFGDVGIEARIEAEETQGPWDDFSVVLGYQDPQNYLYVSFNESNDATTSGIFAVVDGVGTELADLTTPFEGGTSYTVTVTRFQGTIEVYTDYQSSGDAPLVSVDTDLFPTGRVGVGSRNNAVFVDSFAAGEAAGPGGPATFVPEQGTWWNMGPLEPIAGGWTGSVLDDPITTGAGSIGNSNLAIGEMGSPFPYWDTDSQIYVNDVSPAATASAWDDASVVFGYQDPDNYLFLSLNESNDPYTSGIFSVVDGVGTELADLDLPIRGGGTYDVRIDRWGDDIWFYLNGQLIAEAETDLFQHGRWGFGSRNNAASFDPDHIIVWP
ncbi:MAG: hypothetical protein S0880_08715 [Actinomycetota bacterium]|nr:hypothetical protein [Actinomycetota bacterium]